MNAISNGLKKNWQQNDFNSSSSNSSCESERWVCIETTQYQKVFIGKIKAKRAIWLFDELHNSNVNMIRVVNSKVPEFLQEMQC